MNYILTAAIIWLIACLAGWMLNYDDERKAGRLWVAAIIVAIVLGITSIY